MDIHPRLMQSVELMLPGLGVDGHDHAAELGRIERFSQVHEHGFRAAATDAVSKMQHHRTPVTRGCRHGPLRHKSTHRLPYGQLQRVTRAKRDCPHIIDIAFRQHWRQSFRVSNAPDTVAFASRTDSGEP